MNIWQTGANFFTNLWRPKNIGGTYFYPLGTADSFKSFDLLNYFNTIPELNAVINKRARAFSQGQLNVVNEKGEIQDGHWMQSLLKNPNWFQAQKEFMRQTKLWHDIFGNEYIYPFVGVGLPIRKTKALFTLPPQLTDVEYKDKKPYYMNDQQPPDVRYFVKIDGKEADLDKDIIVHLNDNKVNVKEVNDKSVLKGESKMVGLTPALNNIKMAYDSRATILKHRGALGILSNAGTDAAGTIALDPAEKKNVQDSYRNYGGLSGQDQLIITSANLKWQQMSVNPDKLGLFDETEEDFNKILDSYDTPSELFVRKAGATYENQKEARKGWYSDTIIPEAWEWVGALNKLYMADEGKLRIAVDYSHLSIFQEDIAIRADALAKLVTALGTALADGAITIEEYQLEIFKKFGLGSSKPK